MSAATTQLPSNPTNVDWLQTLAKLGLYSMLVGGVGQGVKGMYDLYKPLPDLGLKNDAPDATVLVRRDTEGHKSPYKTAGEIEDAVLGAIGIAHPEFADAIPQVKEAALKVRKKITPAQRDSIMNDADTASVREGDEPESALLDEADKNLKVAAFGLGLRLLDKQADDNLWDKMVGGLMGSTGKEIFGWPDNTMPWWTMAAIPPTAVLGMQAGRDISRGIFGDARKARLKSMVDAKRKQFQKELAKTYLHHPSPEGMPKEASLTKTALGWFDWVKLMALSGAMLKGLPRYTGPAAVLGGSSLATMGLARPWESKEDTDSVPIKDYREALRNRMHRDYDPLTIDVVEKGQK